MPDAPRATPVARAADDFLFALVGEQRNGVGLTVVSALARLGVDPWAEARRLAELPRPQAASRLAPMLDRVPGGAFAPEDVLAIAERLVALLPEPRAFEPAAATGAERASAPAAAAMPRATATWLIVLVVLSALLFALSTRRELSLSRWLSPAAAVSAPVAASR